MQATEDDVTRRTLADAIAGQHTLTLPPSATMREACEAMHARRVGAVLVVDEEGRLIGIFTGRDAVGALARRVDPAATTLAQAMTPNPATLPPDAEPIEALRLMRDGGFRHVPLVKDGRPVGIVSRYDFRAMENVRLEDEIALWERI
jgi:CBS domain-containing protein